MDTDAVGVCPPTEAPLPPYNTRKQSSWRRFIPDKKKRARRAGKDTGFSCLQCKSLKVSCCPEWPPVF
jgi:hypothetical protein